MRTRRALNILCLGSVFASFGFAQESDIGWCAQRFPHVLPNSFALVMPSVVEFVDVNGDNRLDAFANGAIPGLRLLLGTERGFAPATPVLGIESASVIATGDVDRDGNVDLAVRPADAAVIDIYFGDGKGAFAFSARYKTSSVLPSATHSFELGDLDHDGWLDLVATDTMLGELSVHRGIGAGLFGAPTFIALAGYPGRLTLADIDGDGNLDALAEGAVQTVKMGFLRGDGAGGFAAPTVSGLHAYPFELRDMNHDGLLDATVATSSQGAGALRIFLGNGAGVFTGVSSVQLNEELRAVAVGDFDGDGHFDASVSSTLGNTWVARGLGTGQFAAPRKLHSPSNRSGLCAGDVDNDGYDDLGMLGAATFGVFYGSPLQTLVTSEELPLGGVARALAHGDFDGDSFNDVAVGREAGAGWVLELLRGDGDGTLSVGANVALASAPTDLATGDFDGDGRLDLVVASRTGQRVELVRGLPGGTLAPAVQILGGSEFLRVECGDIDNDGLSDVFALAFGANAVEMVKGTFTIPPTATTLPLSAVGIDLALGDIDANGFSDLVVATQAQTLEWRRGSVTGLGSAALVSFGREMTSIDVARVDADAFADVLVGTTLEGFVWRRGSAAGPTTDTVVGPMMRIERVRAADLDSDGRMDMTCELGITDRDYVCVRRGGANGFEGLSCFSFTTLSGARTFVDLDRDGWAEAVNAEASAALLRVSQRRNGPRFESYCPAGTSLGGCVAQLSASGLPSASAGSGLTLTTNNLDGQRSALTFIGTAYPIVQAWAAGSSSFLCLGSPRLRTVAQFSFGTTGQCDGAIAIDANTAALANGLAVGNQVFAQTWYRDPLAPKGGQFSNALAFELGL